MGAVSRERRLVFIELRAGEADRIAVGDLFDPQIEVMLAGAVGSINEQPAVW